MFIFAIGLFLISIVGTVSAVDQGNIRWTTIFVILMILSIVWFVYDISQLLSSHEYKHERAERKRLRKIYHRSPTERFHDWRAGKKASKEHEEAYFHTVAQNQREANRREEIADRRNNA